MNHLNARHHLEQLARQMGWDSDATRTHVELSRIGFGIGNEFGNGLNWNSWMHHHDTGHTHDARDRRNIAEKNET
jgi:NAD dependent epimerase/dehydratase family enzyme